MCAMSSQSIVVISKSVSDAADSISPLLHVLHVCMSCVAFDSRLPPFIGWCRSPDSMHATDSCASPCSFVKIHKRTRPGSTGREIAFAGAPATPYPQKIATPSTSSQRFAQAAAAGSDLAWLKRARGHVACFACALKWPWCFQPAWRNRSVQLLSSFTGLIARKTHGAGFAQLSHSRVSRAWPLICVATVQANSVMETSARRQSLRTYLRRCAPKV